jgi:hypothetical protein
MGFPGLAFARLALGGRELSRDFGAVLVLRRSLSFHTRETDKNAMAFRTQRVESTDEYHFQNRVELRSDYRRTRRFRRRFWSHVGGDGDKARNAAALMLRVGNAWTLQMIGLVFGRGASGAAEMVKRCRAELPDDVTEHFDHKVDAFTPITTTDAETILDRLAKVRHLLPADDLAIDHAAENLSTALATREAD